MCFSLASCKRGGDIFQELLEGTGKQNKDRRKKQRRTEGPGTFSHFPRVAEHCAHRL